VFLANKNGWNLSMQESKHLTFENPPFPKI